MLLRRVSSGAQVDTPRLRMSAVRTRPIKKPPPSLTLRPISKKTPIFSGDGQIHYFVKIHYSSTIFVWGGKKKQRRNTIFPLFYLNLPVYSTFFTVHCSKPRPCSRDWVCVSHLFFPLINVFCCEGTTIHYFPLFWSIFYRNLHYFRKKK